MAAPLHDREGRPRGAVGIFEEIVERNGIPVMIERHQRRIIDAQRLELLGRMTGGIAHDFNNLLTAINGYSELILSRTEENDPIRPLLEEIHGAGVKAASLTRQLLTYGRKHSPKPVRLDLNELVRDMEDMIRRLLGVGIRAEISLPEEHVEASADSAWVRQALLNLVANARDAMPGGGILTLAVFMTEFPDAPASLPEPVRQLPPGRYAVLNLRDTGTGMAPEVRARAFEPYFTTREEGKGTGLGLTMVKGIASLSGGDVGLESKAGEGTSVTLYLPAWVERGVEAGPQQEAKPVPISSGPS
jgi:signal transduction histidine kinase